jgi:hypothetical protein
VLVLAPIKGETDEEPESGDDCAYHNAVRDKFDIALELHIAAGLSAQKAYDRAHSDALAVPDGVGRTRRSTRATVVVDGFTVFN